MKHISYLLICLGLTWACSSPQKETKTEASEEPKTTTLIGNEMLKKAEISIGKAQKTHIRETVQANGMIDVPPQNLASVSTPMAGYVTYTNILPGSKVKKGQVLAVLEHQGFVELQQQYIQSLSRLSLTEKEFDRQKELSAENVSSAKKLQQAESDYKTEKATANALAEK
ncbi:MAG: efflux RND transporter periplasmic adaptor subunit, partial [Cytophagales bacterium]|nr:efflux RND transporter periplasmic adaptor subunit [Cytophagales bacterium]